MELLDWIGFVFAVAAIPSIVVGTIVYLVRWIICIFARQPMARPKVNTAMSWPFVWLIVSFGVPIMLAVDGIVVLVQWLGAAEPQEGVASHEPKLEALKPHSST